MSRLNSVAGKVMNLISTLSGSLWMSTPKSKKMYVLVRKDLEATYRCVQGTHAVAQYSLALDVLGTPLHEYYKEWRNGVLVFLAVRNEDALKMWALKLNDKKKLFQAFREPDLGGQITAIACIDSGEIFRHLPLAV